MAGLMHSSLVTCYAEHLFISCLAIYTSFVGCRLRSYVHFYLFLDLFIYFRNAQRQGECHLLRLNTVSLIAELFTICFCLG